MIKVRRRLAYWGAQVFLYRHWSRYHNMLRSPLPIQQKKLLDILSRNQNCAYGKSHHFSKVLSGPKASCVLRYQDNVPIVRYEDIDPWIQRTINGECNVICTEPVIAAERSSGSTSTNKIIPITQSLLAEIQAGVYPWLYDMDRSNPRLNACSSYWSISTMAKQPEVSAGGIPIGFSDDTAYFGGFMGWSVKNRMSVPGSVAKMPDMERCRYATCLYLLSDPDLGFVSVWSPTFLSLLMDFLRDHFTALVDDIENGTRHGEPWDGVAKNPKRANQLRKFIGLPVGQLTMRIWPKLTLISCWTSAAAALFIPQLKRWFPQVRLQGKGLLATEGIVSIPIGGDDSYLPCVASHFFEFVDVASAGGYPRTIDQLEPGKVYRVVLTTSGGLYRYDLGDLVEVDGFYRNTPSIRFVGRADRRSDICGEKLTPHLVQNLMQKVSQRLNVFPSFAMLSPALGKSPHYQLFIESSTSQIEAFAKMLDTELQSSHHYKQCRRLGQLGPVQPISVDHGMAKYETAMRQRGMKAGDIKPTALHPDTDWYNKMVTC